MKMLIAFAMVLSLNSCNTLIGIGRDGKQAYDWTRSKFQGSGSGYQDDGGAPIY